MTLTAIRLFVAILWLTSLAFAQSPSPLCGEKRDPAAMVALRARIEAVKPDPNHPHDMFALAVVKQAFEGLKTGSGGIGACLVDETTGAIIETGRNRQFTPYFRSDLHAEMDLLNRYEDRLQKSGGSLKGGNPRNCPHIILFSSVEPCPMCLTRILNSGITKMYYLAPDTAGGMVQRMDHLPPFWRSLAEGRDYRQADCSQALQEIARDLFSHSARRFSQKRPP